MRLRRQVKQSKSDILLAIRIEANDIIPQSLEIALAAMEGVHALTDITGFGLAGNGLELACGAGLKYKSSWITYLCCQACWRWLKAKS